MQVTADVSAFFDMPFYSENVYCKYTVHKRGDFLKACFFRYFPSGYRHQVAFAVCVTA
jgi:hypothetical protein